LQEAPAYLQHDRTHRWSICPLIIASCMPSWHARHKVCVQWPHSQWLILLLLLLLLLAGSTGRSTT
jgi:hypothetical protein